MLEFLKWLFDSSFISGGQAFSSHADVFWLQVASDALIAFACYTIPIMLLRVVLRRDDLPFRGLFIMFSACLLAWGTTHLIDLWTVWLPIYRFSGAVKLTAALISVLTAALLGRVIPKALTQPSPLQLESANLALKNEIAERTRAEEEVRKLNEELESRVLDRTGQIRASVQDLKKEIAERKQTETALQQSEARFRAMVEASPLGIFLTDPNGDFLYANRVYQGLAGLTFGEALGKGWRSVLPPEDRERILSEWQRKVQYRAPYQSVNRFLRADGTTVWVHVRAAPIQHGQTWSGYLGTVDDITANRLSEEALRASEERYRELFENANDFVFTTDLTGGFTSINKVGEKITGYSREETVQQKRSFMELAAPEHIATARSMIGRGVGADGPTTHELEIVSKGGDRVVLEVGTRTIAQQGRPAEIQGIARDVTERKRLEEQLRQAQKMDAVGRLAGGVAHDFNNMLTAILGYSDLLLAKLDRDQPLRRHVDEIRKAGERAASLTGQLLAFSRKQVIVPRVLSLNAVVANLDKMLRRLIGEDIEMVTYPAPDLGSIKVDSGQIDQVIMNLVVNARDAMPQGGKLTIETANAHLDEAYARRQVNVKPGHYAMVAVSDTGCGMDAETQSHIFEPFFTTKAPGKGTGLGLATVYAIVQQSGGHLWLYSELGHGTTFKIYFPRVDERVEDVRPEGTITDTDRGSETLLLVEDQEEVRALAREVLQMLGYTVLVAGQGSEAIQLSNQLPGPIHLMLTDVVLPHMSGWELAERFGQARPEMKVLFMSGYTDKALARQGELTEDTPFIQKPFTPALLARRVREVLDN